MKTKMMMLFSAICLMIACKKEDEVIVTPDPVALDSGFANLTIRYVILTNSATEVYNSFGVGTDSVCTNIGTCSGVPIYAPLSNNRKSWYSRISGTHDTTFTWNNIPISGDVSKNVFWYKYDGQQQGGVGGWTLRKKVKKFIYLKNQTTYINDTIKFY